MHINVSATEYVASKGLEFKTRSGQIIIRECPYCHDGKWHFYLDPKKAVFFCHKCNERGTLWSLRKHMGDIEESIKPAFRKPKQYAKPEKSSVENYHQALLSDDDALAYLKGRGFTLETLGRFKFGLSAENGKRWLTVPHYRGGECINIKFRSLPPAEKSFQRVTGCRSVLFNGDCLKGLKEVIITEGELDAITLLQAGMDNVVSGTTGAGSFDPDWIDQLKDLEKVFIVYDPDEAGQRGARSLAKRLGYSRCFNVMLPEDQDVNDFFRAGNDLKAFQTLVRKARRFDLPGIITIDTALDLLLREKNDSEADSGLLTPWDNVNHLIKGFHPGDLVIVSAPPKTGKTTFCLNIAWHQAFSLKPTLFFCLEMRPERLVRKLLEAEYGKNNLGPEELRRANGDFRDFPLYLGHSFKKQKLEDILELIKEAMKRYDLRLVVFDNIHFLVRSISNVNEELGQAVQGFKLLAEEMEIPIMVIAQPRKRESGARDEIMSAEDIKYSNAVHADCDQMLILYRKRVASKAKEIGKNGYTVKTEALDPVTLVRVEAHRYGSGGETLLYFHGEYSRFDALKNQERTIP